MKITIDTQIAKEYGVPGAIVWATFQEILDDKKWTQIRVSQLVSMTDKIFSETPIKVAIRKMEANDLIERISNPASEGASYRFGLSADRYCHKPQSQREQSQSQARSSPAHQDIASMT